MESFLQAVGLSSSPSAVQLRKSSSFKSSRFAKRRSLSVGLSDSPLKSQSREDLQDLLPDLASIAAATEQGILALEEEARSLERAPLQEALQLLQRWSQALRRRPRAEESLASFKAQFLRSNALEKALEGFRKNEPLRNALSDRPLFASSDGSSPAEALMAELRSVLQLCLPRSAAQLAEPTLQAVLAEPAEPSEVAAALTALRAFKEDWREVVRSQAVRGLERRLDSLAYELQKTPGSAALSSARMASHDRVAVLALLCEAIGESHAGAETHASEIDSALQSLGLKSPGGSSSSCRTAGAVSTAAPAERSRASSVISGSSKATTATEWSAGVTGGESMPSISDCDAAVKAMVTKTENGMREGLRLLGLPSSPLHFVPGSELRLCGHDIRVSVCKMIAHWVEEERAAFFDVLLRLRQILQTSPQAADVGATTDAAELMSLRASLIAERQALAEKLRRLDRRLNEVDAQLGRTAPGGGAGDLPPDVVGCEEVAWEGNFPGLSPAPPTSATSTSVTLATRSSQTLTPEMSTIVSNCAEALTSENQRVLERLATSLQQRRTQLLQGLTVHLQGEEERLSALSVAPSGVMGAVEVAAEQLQEALQEARRLCERVEAVIDGPGRSKFNITDLSAGARCRARWMDGNFYDATVHSVHFDGTVVVNWLRPRPSHGDSPDRPLRTISESGGDDTLHRIVPKADIQMEGMTPRGQSQTQAALRFFRNRTSEDRDCVDCGAVNSTDWASLSFGIFLCQTCAEEHQRLGPRRSLVRLLNDGWGWGQRDLKFFSVGGNAAFRACMDKYPAVMAMPISQRYVTRFAEHYRRQLDSLCTGAQMPSPLSLEQASQPNPEGDFFSRAEGLAVAQEVCSHFEEAARIASSQCKLARSSSSAELESRQRRIEAPRSISEATGRTRRHTKVSC